jgi:hypothetical protein
MMESKSGYFINDFDELRRSATSSPFSIMFHETTTRTPANAAGGIKPINRAANSSKMHGNPECMMRREFDALLRWLH